MILLVLICNGGDVTRSYYGVYGKRVVQGDLLPRAASSIPVTSFSTVGTDNKCSRYFMYIGIGNERMRVHPSGRSVFYYAPVSLN